MYMYIIYTHIYNPLYIVGELRYIYIYPVVGWWYPMI